MIDIKQVNNLFPQISIQVLVTTSLHILVRKKFKLFYYCVFVFFMKHLKKKKWKLKENFSHFDYVNIYIFLSKIVEIVPVCKDDLVCLPRKVANSLGNISPLLLCTRVGNTIHLVDTNTLNSADINTNVYWRTPFLPLASAKSLTEYYVLDVEPLGPVKGRQVLADVHVARMSDFGHNDNEFIARSHLGAVLNPGDTVLGYDLSHSNFNNDEFDKLDSGNLTDVILVRKSYPQRRKKHKQRNWKIQQLAKEVDDMLPRKQDVARIENDMEMFMRDIEEDPEFRSTINIFKDKDGKVISQPEAVQPDPNAMTDSSDIEEEDFPEISLEEMLDEMQLNNDNSHHEEHQHAEAQGDDDVMMM